jgi:hypothetical protein
MARKPKATEILVDEDTGEVIDASPAQVVENSRVPDDTYSLTDFLGPDDGSTEIRINRTSPAFHEGHRIIGYCGKLPYGQDIDYIREQWGGGTYKVQKYAREGAKYIFIEQREVAVSGMPRTVPPPSGPVAAPPVIRGTGVTGLGEQSGVSLDGEDREFFKRIERMMLVQSFLKKMGGDDVNTILAGKLVELTTANKSSLGDLSALLEIVDRIKGNSGPSEGGGTTWMDLAAKGLEGFTKLVEKSQPVPVEQQRIVPQPPLLPAPTPVVREGNDMNVMQVANAATACIAAAFLEEPQFTEAQAVEIVRRIVPPEASSGIRDNRDVLWNMAKMALHDKIEPNPQIDQSFYLYFQRVFDIFLGIEPKPEQKGGTHDGTGSIEDNPNQ